MFTLHFAFVGAASDRPGRRKQAARVLALGTRSLQVRAVVGEQRLPSPGRRLGTRAAGSIPTRCSASMRCRYRYRSIPCSRRAAIGALQAACMLGINFGPTEEPVFGARRNRARCARDVVRVDHHPRGGSSQCTRTAAAAQCAAPTSRSPAARCRPVDLRGPFTQHNRDRQCSQSKW